MTALASGPEIGEAMGIGTAGGKVCAVPGCGGKHHSRGLCGQHYTIANRKAAGPERAGS